MILTHGINSLSSDSNFIEIGGRKYPIVQIGNQWWMAENLDYAFSGLSVDQDSCYEDGLKANHWYNDEATYGYNGLKYGLLYNHGTLNYIIQHYRDLGIPEGWRVPSYEDAQSFISAIGGSNSTSAKKVKTASGWYTGTGVDYNGTNELKMSIVPSGKANRSAQGGGGFKNIGFHPAFKQFAGIWMNYRYSGRYAEYYYYIQIDSSIRINSFDNRDWDYSSIRFMKNA